MKTSLLYTLLWLALGSCLFSCSAKASETSRQAEVSLTGRIKNMPASALATLEVFDYKVENFVLKDTLEVGTDGSYALKMPFAGPSMYRVNFFGQKMAILCVVKPENITLNVEIPATQTTSSITGITLEGSEQSAQFLQYIAQREGLSDKYLTPLMKAYNEAQAKNDVAAQNNITGLYGQAYNRMLQEIKPLVLNLSSKNIGGYLAVLEFSFEQEAVFADSVYKNLYGYMPNWEGTQKLNARIDKFRKLANGSVAPDISLQGPDGKTVALKDLRGKYVLLDFWASWCGPCRRENPAVVAAYNRFKSKGFDIYAVSLDNDKAKWETAIAADKLTWPHVSDLKGWQSAPAAMYNVTSIPANFLLDKEGRIIARNLRGSALEAKLEELLGK